MDFITSAFSSLQWLISPLAIGACIASTVVLLTGVPGRIVLWVESGLSLVRDDSSGRMGR